MNLLATLPSFLVPALIAAAGERAAYRFLEFFTARIRAPNAPRLRLGGERILDFA